MGDGAALGKAGRRIARELVSLPLSLDLVGAYAKETLISFDDHAWQVAARIDLDVALLNPQYGGMKSGRAPHYVLRMVKFAFADVSGLNRTMAAAAGADDVGMDEHAVIDVIAHLTPRDFDKSMRSEIDPAVWQDVYKPVVDRCELYVKFTVDARGELLLISFKENEL